MLSKKSRLLYVFYKLMHGEHLSVSEMAERLDVSDKSLYRDMGDLRAGISELFKIGIPMELKYYRAEKTFYLKNSGEIEGSTLLVVILLVIGSRALGEADLEKTLNQLKQYATPDDVKLMNSIISNERHAHMQIYHDNKEILATIEKISRHIKHENEITIRYIKMSKEEVTRRVRPLAITFSDFYFYMCAVEIDERDEEPVISSVVKTFRIDRIKAIIVHRQQTAGLVRSFNVGELKERIQLMQPGRHRKITFEFSGPSYQAILDKFPLSDCVGQSKDGKTHIITADVYDKGAIMFLLSQGSWVKAIAPQDFVDEMKEEIERMQGRYEEADDGCDF